MDSKFDKIKEREKRVVVLTSDERRKIDQAAADARDAIEQVIDKATRATRGISKKLAPAFDTSPQRSYNRN